MMNPKSLGGLVGKPLGFGPIDRGSNPLPDISFLPIQCSIIMAQGGTNSTVTILHHMTNGPMWHHDIKHSTEHGTCL